MNDRKPIEMIINLAVRSGDSIVQRWDQADQCLSLSVMRDGQAVPADAVDTTQFYRGARKLKILSTIRARSSREFSLSQAEIVRNYAHVWAIDTSTEEAFGVTFNAAALCALDPTGGGGIERVGGFLFGNPGSKPERHGWRRWIEFLLPRTDEKQRYAIIVDSEMDLIPQINERVEPLDGDFMLPDRFDLIFATADRAKDQLFNRAISASDRLSRQMRLSVQFEANASHFVDQDDAAAGAPILLVCAPEARNLR